MSISPAHGYKSPAQRARRITEAWFEGSMYCPTCTSRTLDRTRENTRVVDFIFPQCGAEFQLKARSGRLGRKLRDAAYEPMMERIRERRAPHFAFLSYARFDWTIQNLVLVPSHFITPGSIERCRPLSSRARRAGWVGCNVLLDALPRDGFVTVISGGVARSPSSVRGDWSRFRWLEAESVDARGWTTDVLRCVRSLGRGDFRLADIYQFETELAAKHPQNQNVRPKIRQQLQILRDRGVLDFVARGRYRVS